MNRLNQTKNNENSIRLILLFSVVLNFLLFAWVIATYPPIWYTNDDYRMMTIVSGAYTGTPSPDIVFMRYPIGIMLSALYSITTQIPWYGIFTMLCMFIPSCIFCYYLVKKAFLKNQALVGFCLYILLFLFFIRKYICLSQFTLTSAFMGIGATVLILELPAQKFTKHIILATICSVFSFAVRSKAFYMLLPLIALIVIIRLINEKGTKIWKPFALISLSTIVLCMGVFAVDYAMWNRSEEIQEFEQFKVARRDTYDHGSIPNYYDHISFYVSNEISETAYRSLTCRYLDLEKSVDTQTLEAIGEYIDELRISSNSVSERLMYTFEETIEYWLDSGDEIVKYSAIYTFVLLGIYLVVCFIKKKTKLIFPATVAGFVLECIALKFSSDRLIVRIVDMLLLAAAVIGSLVLVDMFEYREKTLKEYVAELSKNKYKLVSVILIILSVATIAFSSIISLNTALKDKYQSATETQNSRLDALKAYAKTQSDAFFFYDSGDFISCTEYVFKTYDEGEVLNHDSLGSWNCKAPTYYERNALFGFTSSADAFTNDECEVYFVAVNEPKLGITKTLKDNYNKTLKLVDSIQSNKNLLHIYMVVDDD